MAVLTMERLRQLVATDGNGFHLSEPFSAPSLLLPVATGCNPGLHKGSIRASGAGVAQRAVLLRSGLHRRPSHRV
jgi:hypothetical protein